MDLAYLNTDHCEMSFREPNTKSKEFCVRGIIDRTLVEYLLGRCYKLSQADKRHFPGR